MSARSGGTDPETGKSYTVPPGIDGISRFLNRLWRHTAANLAAFVPGWNTAADEVSPAAKALRRKTHQTIERVTTDIDRFQFNTAISAMMELLNEMSSYRIAGPDAAWSEALETMVRLLSPFAPHFACELWSALGYDTVLPFEAWPAFDPAIAAEENIEIPVQVNGKMRDKLVVPAGTDQATLGSAGTGLRAGPPPSRRRHHSEDHRGAGQTGEHRRAIAAYCALNEIFTGMKGMIGIYRLRAKRLISSIPFIPVNKNLNE